MHSHISFSPIRPESFPTGVLRGTIGLIVRWGNMGTNGRVLQHRTVLI